MPTPNMAVHCGASAQTTSMYVL